MVTHAKPLFDQKMGSVPKERQAMIDIVVKDLVGSHHTHVGGHLTKDMPMNETLRKFNVELPHEWAGMMLAVLVCVP